MAAAAGGGVHAHDVAGRAHLTALAPFSATPTMEPVVVWWVLIGTPAAEAPNGMMEAPNSAQKPSTGLSWRAWPMVFTMRQPPGRGAYGYRRLA